MVEVLKLHLPKILKSGEAKKSWTQIMNGATEHDKTYVVTGTGDKAVVVMSLAQFEELRDSYTALAEELEAKRALGKDGTQETLERVSEIEESRLAGYHNM